MVGQTTVVLPHDVAGAEGLGDEVVDYVDETGWRKFLSSWKLGAILAAACVAGVIAIFASHPFAAASVSERVSERVGESSLCTAVGAAQLANGQSTIYRCTVGMHARVRPGASRSPARTSSSSRQGIANWAAEAPRVSRRPQP